MVKSMKVARQEGTSKAERETETKKRNRSRSSKVKISDTSAKQSREGTRDYAGTLAKVGNGKRGKNSGSGGRTFPEECHRAGGDLNCAGNKMEMRVVEWKMEGGIK